MIIGLCGEPCELKTSLLHYLSQKGFDLRTCEEIDRLEQDSNYVIDLGAGPDFNLQPWKDRQAVAIWIGRNSQAPPEAERVIAPETPEAVAQEELTRWILAEMHKQERPDWDEYFMKIAQVASMRSNCIKRKVGAVIIRDKRIISTGYNGTPQRHEELQRRRVPAVQQPRQQWDTPGGMFVFSRRGKLHYPGCLSRDECQRRHPLHHLCAMPHVLQDDHQ